MYRIIIADDEPLIIRGLKKMMEWGEMDLGPNCYAEHGRSEEHTSELQSR